MKTKILLLTMCVSLLSTMTALGQNFEIWDAEHGNVTNGAVTVVVGPSPAGEEAYFTHEYHFDVIETAGVEGVQYSARRFEDSFIEGTNEYFCWTDCLQPLAAGSEYMREMQFGSYYLASPNDTMLAGGLPSIYLRPQFETSGTATYRVEVFDVADPDNVAYVDVTWIIDASLVSVDEVSNDLVDLYPMPASSVLNFSLAQPMAIANFQFINILGEVVKEVRRTNVEGNVKLDVSDLSTGVYMLREENMSVTKRVYIVR